MNIETNRQVFLDALRSGKYTQTAHRYRSKDHTCHCALGVGIDALDLWEQRVINVYGIEEALGEDEKLSLFDLVTAWNDVERLTFDEIADRLEARWSDAAEVATSGE